MTTSGAGDAKKAILQWARKCTEDYPNVKIDDLLKSWQDGLALAAIVHHYLPEDKKLLMPVTDLKTDTKEHRLSNIKFAMTVAEQELGVKPIMDPADVGHEVLSMVTLLNHWHLSLEYPGMKVNPFTGEKTKVTGVAATQPVAIGTNASAVLAAQQQRQRSKSAMTDEGEQQGNGSPVLEHQGSKGSLRTPQDRTTQSAIEQLERERRKTAQLEADLRSKNHEIDKLRTELKTKNEGAASGCCVVQ